MIKPITVWFLLARYFVVEYTTRWLMRCDNGSFFLLSDLFLLDEGVSLSILDILFQDLLFLLVLYSSCLAPPVLEILGVWGIH